MTTVKKTAGTDGAGGAAGPERIKESGVKASPGKGTPGKGLDDGAGGAAGPERIKDSGVKADPGKGKTGKGEDDGHGGAAGPENIKESGLASGRDLEGVEKADAEREEARKENYLDRLDADEDRKEHINEQRLATQELDREQAAGEKDRREAEREADNARTMTIKEEGDISGPNAVAQPSNPITEAKADAIGEERYREEPNTNKSHKRLKVPDLHGKADYVDPEGVDTDLRLADPIDQRDRTNKTQAKEAEAVLKRPDEDDLTDDELFARRQGLGGDAPAPTKRPKSHAANPDHGGISAGLGQESADQSGMNSTAVPESVPPSDETWVEPAEHPSNAPREDRNEDPDKDPTEPPYTPNIGVPQ